MANFTCVWYSVQRLTCGETEEREKEEEKEDAI